MEILSLVFHMPEVKSYSSFSLTPGGGKKYQVGFAFPVPVVVVVGMKTHVT